MARKTATSRAIPTLKDEDIGLILDALRIARDTCMQHADDSERLAPTNASVEYFRLSAERFEDLRASLDL